MKDSALNEPPKSSPVAKFLVVVLLIYALIIGGLYYLVYSPQTDALNEARREASQFAQEASALRTQVGDLERMIAEIRETSAGLEAQIVEKESELSAARSTQQELVSVFQQEIASGQIQVERMRDNLRVDMVNEILFDSGEVTLKPEGIDVLRRMGEVFNRATDRQIIVQGHTDNVTIGGRLAQRYATNWELSSARAVNVARFLQEEVDVDPTRLSATGFSEYQPRTNNETAEDRQMNRRIEILLAPLPEPFPAAPRSSD